MEKGEESRSFNVGGCVFSIPLHRLAQFQDSLLLKPASAHAHRSAVFIDRDGCAFRHVHYYISTRKLTSACASEMNLLQELAEGLHLTSLQQALGKRLQLTDSKPKPERSGDSTPPSAVHKVMPQGLVSMPLVASKEEVLYCFVLLEHVRLHPGLITHDNLLWLCEDVAIIKCSSHLFRFIANFLQSGTILLPELFSEYGELCDNARMMGMTEFIETLQEMSDWKHWSSSSDSCSEGLVCCAMEPLYVLSSSLLVKYPDSSLGQLCVDSNLEGSRLYITGTGVLFQHIENWLGTSRLPLTRTAEELPCLCAYLDNQDGVYLAIREAMREHLHRKETSYMSAMSWSASVSMFTFYKVVKVYAGTHWYATYFKTLIKHPELLSNSMKSKWIVFGESLLVNGDGQMFRHILNFLRCGRLLLPADFREWPLLCQEIEAFQIPALSTALQNSPDYRAWCKARAQIRNLSCKDEDIISDSSLHSEKSLDVYEALSIQRESPDNTSERSSTHPENEAVSVSVGASGITEAIPAATEKTEQTEEISLSSLMCTSPPGTAVSGDSCAHDETMNKNSSKLLPASTACSGRKGVSEDYWNREMASILHMLQESRQKEDSALLERLALLMETSMLSKPELMKMLSELSDREKSAFTVTLVTTFFRNWQSCKEQQSSDTISAEREHTHTEERPGHTTHIHGELRQNPSRDQIALQRESTRGSVFHITSFTSPVGGWVLMVEHPAVLWRGEAGGYFTHSIIYTDQQPQMVQPASTAGSDVAFAYFNMSYEEMVYARECHAFLTGTILDSRGLDSKDCIVKLVHHLWTGHMGVETFVQELLTVIRVGSYKQLEEQEKLLQWVQGFLPHSQECLLFLFGFGRAKERKQATLIYLHFTLPLAKKYTACVRELLRKTSLHTVCLFPPDLPEITVP